MLNSLFDLIYKHKKLLLKYFAVAIACSLVRAVVMIVLPFAAQLVHAVIFYILLKKFVFTKKLGDIFMYLTQIMVYLLCMAAVFLVTSFVTSLLSMATVYSAVAMSLGGVIGEILCLLLMVKVAFKKML